MEIQDIQAISQTHGVEFTFDIMPNACFVLAWAAETDATGKQDLLGTGNGATPDDAVEDVMKYIRNRLN